MLSNTSKYALIILRYLANSNPHSYHTVSEIAEVTSVPSAYLSKLAIELSRAGILQSKRGTGGGIRLNAVAHDRTLFEMCQLMKDPLVSRECLLCDQWCDPNRLCQYNGTCREVEAIRESLLCFLRSSNIGSLMSTDALN